MIILLLNRKAQVTKEISIWNTTLDVTWASESKQTDWQSGKLFWYIFITITTNCSKYIAVFPAQLQSKRVKVSFPSNKKYLFQNHQKNKHACNCSLHHHRQRIIQPCKHAINTGWLNTYFFSNFSPELPSYFSFVTTLFSYSLLLL